MKLNKKGICVLSLGLVLLALVIGCFTVGSVDYDETEVYNEINFIKEAAITSNHLREETENIVNIYDNYKTYNEYAVEEFDELSDMLDIISDMDFDIIKDYCDRHEKDNEISYERLMNLYNATRRRFYYCSYIYEYVIIDNVELNENDIHKMKMMLETCEGYSEINDNLKVYANMYDKELNFEEYK